MTLLVLYIVSILLNLLAGIEIFIKEKYWKRIKKSFLEYPTKTISYGIAVTLFLIILILFPILNFFILAFYFSKYGE